MTNFEGVLVQRQFKPGQKYIQLVFRTSAGVRLSLTRNVRMVQELAVGKTYLVQGKEHVVGQKRYIHEPSATLVRAVRASFFKSHLRLISVIAILVVSASATGTVAAVRYASASSQSAHARNLNAEQQKLASDTGIASQVAGSRAKKQSGVATTATPTPSPSSAPTPLIAQVTTRQTAPALSATPTPQPEPEIPIIEAPVVTTPLEPIVETEPIVPNETPVDPLPTSTQPPVDAGSPPLEPIPVLVVPAEPTTP